MTDDSLSNAALAKRVHDMVRAYVMRKTEDRARGVTWEEFKGGNDPEKKRKYREAREKICKDAFLALRGRRAQEDFVNYFTGTICSVPQFLPESEYQSIARVLLAERWEEIKTLSMLALSGLSSLPEPRGDPAQ